MLLTFRYSKVLLFAELNIISFVLVQLREIKIILGAVGALVVELEHAHVLLLDLHSAIVKWVSGVLASGNSDNHIRGQHCAICSFDTLGRDAKYFTHWLLAISFDCKYKDYYRKSQGIK